MPHHSEPTGVNVGPLVDVAPDLAEGQGQRFPMNRPLGHLQEIIISLSIIRYSILNRMKSVNWVRGYVIDDYEYKP